MVHHKGSEYCAFRNPDLLDITWFLTLGPTLLHLVRIYLDLKTWSWCHDYAFVVAQVETEKRRAEQREYGVFFDDDYDYLQHLKEASGTSEWVAARPSQIDVRNEEGEEEEEEEGEDTDKTIPVSDGVIFTLTISESNNFMFENWLIVKTFFHHNLW